LTYSQTLGFVNRSSKVITYPSLEQDAEVEHERKNLGN
jgi:urea transport system permease protein